MPKFVTFPAIQHRSMNRHTYNLNLWIDIQSQLSSGRETSNKCKTTFNLRIPRTPKNSPPKTHPTTATLSDSSPRNQQQQLSTQPRPRRKISHIYTHCSRPSSSTQPRQREASRSVSASLTELLPDRAAYDFANGRSLIWYRGWLRLEGYWRHWKIRLCSK